MPDNKGGIPKTVTLNGVEFTVADNPDLLALVQAGRKDEKDKLYTNIATLEAQIKVMKDEAVQNGTQSKADKDALKALQDELAVAKEDLKKAKEATPPTPTPPAKKKKKDDEDEDDDDNQPKYVGMKPEEVKKMVDEALAKQAQEHKAELEKVQGNLNTKTVEDYRKEVLTKNQGLLIEALVPEGLDSVEAVNKAVEKALETSKQYIRKDYTDAEGKVTQLTLAEIEAKEAEQKTPPAQPANPNVYVPTGGNPTPPPSGNGDISGKELLKDVKNMSPADFAKHREAIRQEVRKISYTEGS